MDKTPVSERVVYPEELMTIGNAEAERGAIPLLSRNCDGNERRVSHYPADKDGKAGK